nr:hypothetical protein [Candidatus Sigynarchaeota archaeon]
MAKKPPTPATKSATRTPAIISLTELSRNNLDKMIQLLVQIFQENENRLELSKLESRFYEMVIESQLSCSRNVTDSLVHLLGVKQVIVWFKGGLQGEVELGAIGDVSQFLDWLISIIKASAFTREEWISIIKITNEILEECVEYPDDKNFAILLQDKLRENKYPHSTSLVEDIIYKLATHFFIYRDDGLIQPNACKKDLSQKIFEDEPDSPTIDDEIDSLVKIGQDLIN